MTRLKLLVLLALTAPLSAQTVVGTIDLQADAYPYAVAVDEVTNTIYVANSDGTLSAINGDTNAVETIDVNQSSYLSGVAVNTPTNTLYVSDGDGYIVVINGSNQTIVERINLGGRPLGLAVNETTNTAYVALQSAGAVAFIDGSNNSVTIPTTGLGSQQPLTLAVNETTNRLYVAERDGELTVLDATTGAILANPVIGGNLQWVAVDETTNRVYVSDRGNDVVVVVDGATNQVLTTIPVGVGPQGVGVDESRGLVYVSNEDDATVSVINAVTNEVITTLNVGPGPFTVAPFGVGVNATTNRVYVANLLDDSVSIIGPSSPVTVEFATTDFEAVEGETVTIALRLSDAAAGGETATVVLDYTSTNGADADDLGGFTSETVTFDEGETSGSFEITVANDGIAEGEESFTLAIESADGLDLSDGTQITITVARSNAAVQFADAAFMVAEGATATLSLTLGSPAVGGETVDVVLVATSPDGADADDIGGFETQTVTFAAGTSMAAVEVAITDDGRTEGAESFTFEIRNTTGLEIGTPAQTVVTVDPSATSVSFSADTLTTSEEVGTVGLEVVFGEALVENGSFDVVLAGASPDGAGADDLDGFESVTVEVQAGATSVTVEIPVTDDTLVEGPETFEFEIQNATGGGPQGLALDSAQLTLTINDNDNPVANEADTEASTVGFAYPNPTTSSAWLQIAVDVPQRVRVVVLDVVGRVVGVPFEGEVSGAERIEVGGNLAPGTYVVQIVGETVSGTRKLTIAR